MVGLIFRVRRWALAGMVLAAVLCAAPTVIPPVPLSIAQWASVILPDMPLGIVAHSGGLWVCGAHEMIAASSDGGRTWTLRHENSQGEMLFSISFVNDNDAYAMGSGGVRLQTRDGGVHWNNVRSTAAVRDIQFTSLKTGFGIFNGILLSTSDGGWHWNESMVMGDSNHDDRAQELVVLDALHAVAWLDFDSLVPKPAGLAATSDGGRHWALSRLAPTLTAGGVVVEQGKYHLYASDGADPAHPRQVHLLSSDGLNWQDAAPPPLPYTDCARQGCLTSDGWGDLSGPQPAYFRLPPSTLLTHAWAGAGGSVCELGEHLLCALAPAAAGPAAAAVPPSGVLEMPTCQSCPDPLPPPSGLEGTVEIWMAIDSSGAVQQPQVLEASWAGLATSSLQVVRGWRYHPARRQGRAVPVHADVQFLFQIKGR